MLLQETFFGEKYYNAAGSMPSYKQGSAQRETLSLASSVPLSGGWVT